MSSSTFLLILAGFAPSVIWLWIFLKRDPHPEPRGLLVRTFFLGIIIAPLVVLLEFVSNEFAKIDFISPIFNRAIIFFLLAAFVEEYMKYFIVRMTLLKNPAFDEPIDAMIYMITAALGFAALENILVLFHVFPNGFEQTLGVWTLRFGGATLLHALASAIVGYFLAMAWFFDAHKKKLVAIGIIIASFFHFTFNILVFSQNETGFQLAIFLLLSMVIFISILFHKIKNRQRYLQDINSPLLSTTASYSSSRSMIK